MEHGQVCHCEQSDTEWREPHGIVTHRKCAVAMEHDILIKQLVRALGRLRCLATTSNACRTMASGLSVAMADSEGINHTRAQASATHGGRTHDTITTVVW